MFDIPFVVFDVGHEFLSVVIDLSDFSDESFVHLIDSGLLLLDGFLNVGEEVAESFGVDRDFDESHGVVFAHYEVEKSKWKNGINMSALVFSFSIS